MVKGQYGEEDLIKEYYPYYGSEFEIHGMYPETTNTIIISDGENEIIKEHHIGKITINNTDIKLKYDIKTNNIIIDDKYKNNPELLFVSILEENNNKSSNNTVGIGDSWEFVGVIAISHNGYVRYINNKHTYISKLDTINNKIVLYENIEGGDKDSSISDLLGNTIVKYQSFSHHDTIKKGENYLYLSSSQFGHEDRLIEIDKNGNIINDKNFATLIYNAVKNDSNSIDVLKKIVFNEKINNVYITNNENKQLDWFHANSIVYDSNTDILYVSGRTQGVLAIDYSNWKLIWYLADNSFISKSGSSPNNLYLKDIEALSPYRVKGDGLINGPKNQHSLFILPNGNIGMFDNQGDETVSTNGSRYIEYKISGSFGNYTAETIYEYKDNSLYSQIMSDVDYSGEQYQNLLLCYSYPKATILEVNKESKEVVFRLDLPFSTYRIDKMPLYYDENRIYTEESNLKNK